MKFDRMVAVVTGGAQGIGRRIAEELLIMNCRVVVIDFDTIKSGAFQNDAHQNDHDEKELKCIDCDVRDQQKLLQSLVDAKDWYGRLDIVINCAGIFSKDPEQNRSLLEIKLVATVDVTTKAIELMSKGNEGRGGDVVNISSTSGLKLDKTMSATDTACEHGVVAFTRAIALYNYDKYDKENNEGGVRVNCICPGPVDTKNAKFNWARRPSTQEFVKHVGKIDVNEVVKASIDVIEKQTNGKVYSIVPQSGIKEEK